MENGCDSELKEEVFAKSFSYFFFSPIKHVKKSIGNMFSGQKKKLMSFYINSMPSVLLDENIKIEGVQAYIKDETAFAIDEVGENCIMVYLTKGVTDATLIISVNGRLNKKRKTKHWLI